MLLLSSKGDKMITCSNCKASVHKLEVFPGEICLKCYELEQLGKPLPTAGELRAMWGM